MPGGCPKPVTTPLSPLALRKPGCHNRPLKETHERLDAFMAGGGAVQRGTARTQASVYRGPLPFGAQPFCHHPGCAEVLSLC
jgi:hypothetical protein